MQSPNPSTSITVFDFYIKSFDELQSKMREHVGFDVKVQHIWTMNIGQGNELNNLHVTLTIIYWESAYERANGVKPPKS